MLQRPRALPAGNLAGLPSRAQAPRSPALAFKHPADPLQPSSHPAAQPQTLERRLASIRRAAPLRHRCHAALPHPSPTGTAQQPHHDSRSITEAPISTPTLYVAGNRTAGSSGELRPPWRFHAAGAPWTTLTTVLPSQDHHAPNRGDQEPGEHPRRPAREHRVELHRRPTSPTTLRCFPARTRAPVSFSTPSFPFVLVCKAVGYSIGRNTCTLASPAAQTHLRCRARCCSLCSLAQITPVD